MLWWLFTTIHRWVIQETHRKTDKIYNFITIMHRKAILQEPLTTFTFTLRVKCNKSDWFSYDLNMSLNISISTLYYIEHYCCVFNVLVLVLSVSCVFCFVLFYFFFFLFLYFSMSYEWYETEDHIKIMSSFSLNIAAVRQTI